MKIWIDGRVVDGKDARVSVLDHGLLYGDGVFEGLRIYGRRVFRLEAHLKRFAVSAKAICLELLPDLSESSSNHGPTMRWPRMSRN